MTISNTTSITGAAGGPTPRPTAAQGSRSGTQNNFLSLQMTPLKNQDPTSPMDTNAFTTQLVQYSSVEQQINTNTNLTNLITATQSNTMLQSSALVGKQVTATNDHLALQNGQAAIHFDAKQAAPVTVTVTSPSGETLLQSNVSAKAGTNDWSWDGKDSNGNRVVDGSYKVMVNDQSGTALATTVTGTVTGMTRSGTTVSAVLGGLQTDVNSIQSVVTPGS